MFRIKFDKSALLNIIATFFVNWPLTIADSKYFLAIRYFLLFNLEQSKDIKIEKDPVIFSLNNGIKTDFNSDSDDSSNISNLNSYIKQASTSIQDNKKTETNASDQSIIDLMSNKEKTKNINENYEYIIDKQERILDVVKPKFNLDEKFTTKFNKLDLYSKKITLDLISDYFEKHNNIIDFQKYKEFIVKFYDLI
ncbi:hypothetical protein EDEG_02812 [Edhazardia aedis USNM 41457]|uniref:Uncharacterized protein n=1 Tax=Edhazardia aedis (strain USNM 41457) TaxID=1003232 RepID=J9DJJ7_EDHAE|nr:hypothetical protein EDEG_02812 [Edhazardia aedis USNM 41457]|eukprot:EJW02790.1 hypothetical protein EDEG_02812 [Edhazardia aedis USNM 41457]